MIKRAFMFARLKNDNRFNQYLHVKYFSLQDAATALRPFIFMVHPDFFGQFPTERAVNENSLKLLNQYLTSYHNSRNHKQTSEILFYVKKADNFTNELKPVKIQLDLKNLRDTVVIILKSVGLPDEHVPELSKSDANRPIEWHPSYYAATGKKNPHAHTSSKPPTLSLRAWIKENIAISKEKAEAVRFIKDDIQLLLNKLQQDLCLHSIRCDTVWGLHNFRGCLKSFNRLCSDQPLFVREVLKDRVLVFSNTTGVSRSGEIVLSAQDVPEYWYALLNSVPAYGTVLSRLPKMEEWLSSLLNGISIVRKEKRHGLVMAEQYELMLNKLINTLRQCQENVKETFQHSDLSGLQIIVDGDASPLTLSPNGQFLIPASIPGILLVDFINKHKDRSQLLTLQTQHLLEEEMMLKQEAKQVLGLLDLDKDESVTPQQMISCCQRLVQQGWTFSNNFFGSRLRVSHFHSIMQDGEICFPWNWVGTDD